MTELHFTPRPELRALIMAEGIERVDHAHGFEIRAERMNSSWQGFIDGYIKIPIGHPWFGLGYDAEELSGVEVHGGLTYANSELRTPEGYIAGWWLGFDTAHAGDLSPSVDGHNFSGDTYKDMEFVMSELVNLARQAKEATDNVQ